MTQAHLHSVLTDAEYDAAKAEFIATYGTSNAEAAALRDQALARLFHRSGWTQEKLAAKEGKSPQWIFQRLLFGRFLNFSTTVENPVSAPHSLTERAFRRLWEQTEGPKEQPRFQAVLKMLQAAPVVSPKNGKAITVDGERLGPKVVKLFANGQWHPIADMVEQTGATETDINNLMERMRKSDTYNCSCEKKIRGGRTEYRMFRRDKTVSLGELIEKLTPIVKGLEEQGRKNYVTVSAPTVAKLAAALRKLLNEWAE